MSLLVLCASSPSLHWLSLCSKAGHRFHFHGSLTARRARLLLRLPRDRYWAKEQRLGRLNKPTMIMSSKKGTSRRENIMLQSHRRGWNHSHLGRLGWQRSSVIYITVCMVWLDSTASCLVPLHRNASSSLWTCFWTNKSEEKGEINGTSNI